MPPALFPQSQSQSHSQSGSQTQTVTSSSDHALQATSELIPAGTLRLRGSPRPPQDRRRIRWAEDVVDNEGLGRKSSKVCCIYHPAREFGESSSDDTDSSSSDDSESEDGGKGGKATSAKMGGKGKSKETKDRRNGQSHDDTHSHDHGHHHDSGRSTSPNAYERIPKPRSMRTKASGSATVTEAVQ